MVANDQLGGEPHLKYFDLSGFGGLAGRGGVLRFFFLQHGIKFSDEHVDFSKWGSGLKQQVIDSSENPMGTLPVVTLGGEKLFNSHSTARFLSRKLGLYGSDAVRDYQVDVLLESLADWRAAWSTATFGDVAGKAMYKDETRPAKLTAIETLLSRFHASGPHLVGDTPSPAGPVLFAQLWDDVGIFGAVPLDAYPHVKAFYEAYHALPAVKQWCDAARPAAAST